MQLATWVIFIIVYAGLGLGHLPKLTMDRAGIALTGSAAILLFGILDLRAAVKAIDYETIVLLFSMMAIVAFLNESGFFALVAEEIAKRFKTPRAFLAAVIVASGALSAVFVNDVVCVALTPLVLRLCERMKRPPLPFLLALATASNVGSVATITGNPQNVIIGALAHISYLRFASRLAPVAIMGLALNYLVIAWVFRKALRAAAAGSPAAEPPRAPQFQDGNLLRSLIVSVAVVISFFFVSSLATAAFVGACALLFQKIEPAKIYRRIDWPLLMMFAGLFIVVHAFDVRVAQSWGLDSWAAMKSSPVMAVSLLSTALSNLVSNVPAVLLFKPLINAIQEKEQAWLALSMSSTLAGNLTVLGSVANLIVVESCRREGIRVSFFDYLKVGVPIAVLTLGVGMLWLEFVRY